MNKLKLKSKMVESNLTVQQLAKSININKSTFYRRLNRKEGNGFTVEDAIIISDILHLTPDDILNIFFDHNVA